MANILCYLEQSGGEPTPSSLETLGQARRLGSALGATVFVAVALDRAPGYGDDDVLAKLAAGGADKVLLLVGEAFGTDPLAATWESHGAAIATAWDLCQPALALLPSTGGGRELAVRAAARVGAAFLHDAYVEMHGGELFLAERVGDTTRVLPSDLDFPVVATLPPGRYATAAGDEEAEVEVLQTTGASRFAELDGTRVAAPLRARVEVPSALSAMSFPAPLAGAERAVSAGECTFVLVELTTGKGPLRIALGQGASAANADFAADGAADDLIGRLFSARAPGRARNRSERRT